MVGKPVLKCSYNDEKKHDFFVEDKNKNNPQNSRLKQTYSSVTDQINIPTDFE